MFRMFQPIWGFAVLYLTATSPLWCANPVTPEFFPSFAFEASPNGDQFLLRRRHYAMSVDGRGFDLRAADGSQLRIGWRGGRPDAVAAGVDPREGVTHRYPGRGPGAWRTDIKSFERVRVDEVYPGIDVVVYGTGDRLEYDFAVKPRADVSRIRIEAIGGSRLRIDGATGDLVAEPSNVRQRRPRSFQVRDGVKVEVASRYRLLAPGVAAIDFGEYDPGLPLTVDPEFVFSTYLGGTEYDVGSAVAADANFLYVAGITRSTDFPTLVPHQANKKGGEYDAWVMKINRTTRALVYSTYLGSSNDEKVAGIVVDGSGAAYVAGETIGSDFPLRNPARATFEFQEAFIAKLSASGALVYSTFLGGDGAEEARRIRVDSAGNAYVAGNTTSSVMPAESGAYQRRGGLLDSYVTKLNAAGSTFLFTSVFGGAQSDILTGMALDSSGNILMAGETASADFPVTAGSSLGPETPSRPMAFVTKLNAAASALVYSRVVGDRTANGSSYASDVAVDAGGNAYVAGRQSLGSAFPLLNEFQSFPFIGSCFVARFGTDGTPTLTTPIGNLLCDHIVTDSANRIWLGARPGFASPPPLVGALAGQTSALPQRTIIPLQLASDGQSILFSTALAASDLLLQGGMALEGSNLFVVGTAPSGLPTAQPIYNFAGGFDDAFVSQYATASGPTCTFTVSPAALTPFPASGGTRTISVTTQAGCYWNAIAYGGPALSPTDTWTEGTGSGTITVTAPPTGRLDRTFEIVAAGKRVRANQLGSGCTPQAPTVTSFPAAGGTGQLTLNDGECVYTASANVPWITIGRTDTGFPVLFTVAANATGVARTGQIQVGSSSFTISQDGVTAAVTLNPGSANVNGAIQLVRVTVTSTGSWTARSNATWLGVSSPQGGLGTGNGTLEILVADNGEPTPRTGTVTVNNQTFTVNQAFRVELTLAPTQLTNVPAAGASGSITVTSNTPSYSWVALANSSFIKASGSATGNGTVTYTVDPNPTGSPRTGAIFVGSKQFDVTQAAGPALITTPASGLYFRRLAPCRLVDTREDRGTFGKPSLFPGMERTFRVRDAGCGTTVSSAGGAYSLNVTVVPKGPLGYLTIWPAGAQQPFVSTLNSADGRVKANAAIVPSGVDGSISLAVTDETDVVIDINGEFVPDLTAESLVFHPVTPCRLADTREGGGAPIAGGGSRSFAISGGACGVPANAQAYALNATAVAGGALGYITMWGAGQTQPFVSTLNAPKGGIVANAAIVPAGTSGAISVFASNPTHLVLDVTGYFARPGVSASPQRFFPVAPCRLLDTRNAAGNLGGPVMEAGQSRSYDVRGANCLLPSGAAAYSLNATVVPAASLGYLTLWAAGAAQPFVSTLNATDDKIVANAAIVPAGTNGAVSAYVTDRTHLIIDTNGYFAP